MYLCITGSFAFQSNIICVYCSINSHSKCDQRADIQVICLYGFYVTNSFYPTKNAIYLVITHSRLSSTMCWLSSLNLNLAKGNRIEFMCLLNLEYNNFLLYCTKKRGNTFCFRYFDCVFAVSYTL